MHTLLVGRSKWGLLALPLAMTIHAPAFSQTFDSMGYTWNSTASASFYEAYATSFTLYGAEAADQVVTTPLTVTPGDTLSYDYFLSGVGPDNSGLGSDASVNFREGQSDAPWPDVLAAPRLVFDIFGGASGGVVSAMDLQDVLNNDYAVVGGLTPDSTGLHIELYVNSESTAQLKIWNTMSEPVGDPVFDSAASGVAFDMDGSIESIRIGIWNSPGQYLTVSNLSVVQGDLPEGLSGDFNGDGAVNAADYTVWRDNSGAIEDGAILGGNGNGDGAVDIADYGLWKDNFGASIGSQLSSGPAASVPEPTSVSSILFLVAAGGIVVGRRPQGGQHQFLVPPVLKVRFGQSGSPRVAEELAEA